MTTLEPIEVLRQISRVLPYAVIAVDFDGTVTPISPHPADAVPNRKVVEQLVRLAGAGAKVAVITGRTAATAVHVGGLAQIPGVIVEGMHGAERWHRGRLDTPATPEAMPALRDELSDLVARLIADPHVWIEDKRLSLVVHARLTDDPEGVLATLRGPVTALARDHGMEVRPGAQVLEICVPGIDKAGAVSRLVDDATQALLYIGDDVGDLPAFAAVREWRNRTAWPGLIVGVVPGPDSPIAGVADLEVADPAAVGELLERLRSRPDQADLVS
jgi:trehalose 6-phosphate phosphatase